MGDAIGGDVKKFVNLGVWILVISVMAPLVIVWLGNLSTAMSGTALATLFSTTLLGILFAVGIFYVAYRKMAGGGKRY